MNTENMNVKLRSSDPNRRSILLSSTAFVATTVLGSSGSVPSN